VKNLLVLISFFLLISCDKASDLMKNKKWQWQNTKLLDGQLISPIKKDSFIVSINIDQQQFTAKTDCNRFFGSFKITEKEINFDNIGSTRMRCKDSQERVFIDQMAKSITYQYADEQLILFDSDKNQMFFTVKN
jgi:heat shock protein HslJ